MKKIIFACGVALAAFAMTMTSCSTNADPNSLKTNEDSLSYYLGASQGQYFIDAIATLPEADKAKFEKEDFLRGLKTVLDADTSEIGYLYGLSVGMSLASNMKNFESAGINFNRDLLYAAFAKAFEADTITAADRDSVTNVFRGLIQQAQGKMMQYQQEQQRKAIEEAQKKAETNEKAGAEFLKKKMAEDKDIKVTSTGLAYKVLAAGEGAPADSTDRVSVIYTGKLIDGKEFDSSNGEPRTFSVRGVVPGFSEALRMMPKGAKYTIYIPANLGYGVQGTPDIEPGSMLIFDLEVADIIKPAK